MKIWIDADACPKVIKEIIFRASERTKTPVVAVANRMIGIPKSGLISVIQVSAGFDRADEQIILEIKAGDLVITADIPLADAVVQKGGLALDPRGELYDSENIKDRLATRDLLSELRDSGLISGGPKAFSLKDRQAFANKLDKILAQKSTKTR